MAATTETDERGTGASTPTARLKFDVIEKRAAQILGVPVEDVNDQMIADLVGLDARTTVWRYRTGRFLPRLDIALDIAAALNLPVEQIAERTPRTES